MMRRGYTEEFANRVFKQLEGFGSYGFPESHAVSFALLVYISSWLKCYYPDVFAAALLNSMPMGFYQPAQIIIDAQKHGVEVRPVDINYSYWDNTLELQTSTYCPLRLGFRQVKGLNEDDIQILVAARQQPFTNISTLLDAGVSLDILERLADADAFRSIGLDRRQALWEVAALGDNPTGIYTGQVSESVTEHGTELPIMTLPEHVLQDYDTIGLSLKAHPVSFVREKLSMLNILPCKQMAKYENGDTIKVAGLVLVRQRPGTASGICFITLEDETGIANLVVFQKLFDKYRKEILRSKLLMVEGKLQKEGEVIHVVVSQCYNMNGLLKHLSISQQEPEISTTSRADEKDGELDPPHVKKKQMQRKIQGEMFHGGEEF